jgi:NADPH-dependent 2,4-dienoyl-CoA reductase/sulfur reductase-like enzyme
VERSNHALLRDDPALTAAVRKQLELHGVELRCGVSVNSLDEIPADIVVISAGFKPNVELAAEAGVEIGRTRAIRTDDRMETNLRGVFAAGDCAEVQHLVTGRPTYVPLGTTANKAGRVAGANAAGGRERFAGIVGTSIVGIFGM